MHIRIILLFLLIGSTHFASAQTTTGTIVHDGITRDYIVHLPTNYDDSQSYPFVYNLHGFTSNATQQQLYSGMNSTANENGFIVCYPNGLISSWNVGWNFGSNSDDVGFLLALVDSLALDYNINTDRLYSCGMSNGGFMSYRLACELSENFAAVASVTGSIVPSMLDQCDPSRSIPVMQIHGTADPTVDYNGSFIGSPIEEVVEFWVEKNGCNPIADTLQLEDINTSDESTVERITYTEGVDGTEVVFYKIEGGAHTWPDASFTIGVTNRDFNANQEIWNFFNKFDKNGAITTHTENTEISSDIRLFPNPSTSQMTLSNLPEGTSNIQLVNSLGNVVLSKEISNSSSEINVEHLANGIYYIIVQGKLSEEVLKFVKH